MKRYYALTGRIPGDDEDTQLAFSYPLDNRDHAIDAFKLRMLQDTRLSSQEIEDLESEHGAAVFVNSICSSESPIIIE